MRPHTKFTLTVLAYGKSMNVLIPPDIGKLFGLTDDRQVITIEITVRKNKMRIIRRKNND